MPGFLESFSFKNCSKFSIKKSCPWPCKETWLLSNALSFFLSLQKTLSEPLCTSSLACASVYSWPWPPWWWGSPAVLTAGRVPGGGACRTMRVAATAATARMAARTRPQTCRCADTAALRGLWTRMCSPLQRSWSAHSGWRSASASLGRSGWTGSPRCLAPGA